VRKRETERELWLSLKLSNSHNQKKGNDPKKMEEANEPTTPKRTLIQMLERCIDTYKRESGFPDKNYKKIDKGPSLRDKLQKLKDDLSSHEGGKLAHSCQTFHSFLLVHSSFVTIAVFCVS
jgi:hypothetical protein